jgi:hypothetical protein
LFDLRCRRGRLLFQNFEAVVFPWPVIIAVKIGVMFMFSFCLSCTLGKNYFFYSGLCTLFPFLDISALFLSVSYCSICSSGVC